MSSSASGSCCRERVCEMAFILYYRLEGHTPVPCTLEELEEGFKDFDRYRLVRQTEVGDILVSTVFLGIDHSHSMSGTPILFETMVFGGPESVDQQQIRYETWEQAEAGHASMVALVQAVTGRHDEMEVVEHRKEEQNNE